MPESSPPSRRYREYPLWVLVLIVIGGSFIGNLLSRVIVYWLR
jgi:hypothetical protein